MKRLIAIFLLFVAITTATFAGTGITTVAQGRTLAIEVVDNNFYNVTVLNENNGVISTQTVTNGSGALTIGTFEGIKVIITNMQTGAIETIPLLVK